MTCVSFPLRALAAIAVVLAALALGAPSAFGVPRASHQATVVVSGKVVDANQEPIASLQVVLNLPIVNADGTINRKSLPIGQTTTDAQGAFTIKVEITPQLRKLAAPNDNWLNFDLLLYDTSVTLYRSVPRRIVKTTWAGPDETGGSTDLGTIVFAPEQPGAGSIKRRSLASVVAGARQSDCVDTNTTLASGTLTTIVGEAHTATGSAHASYGPTADSYISVVVMIGAGPWTESAGDVHVGNTLGSAATADFGPGSHRLLKTYFRYVRVRSTNPCTGTRYAIKATRWMKSGFATSLTADVSQGCAAAPFSSHVQSFGSGATFTRSSNPAFRWSPAVSLTPVSGPAALATARSGYTSKVWIRWTFPSGGKLCGDTAGPGSSKRIGAGA